MLGKRYDFSPRLLAIMRTEPSEVEQVPEEKASRFRQRRKQSAKEADLELAEVVVTGTEDHKGRSKKGDVQSEISHYTLAEQMINYQSIDFGTRCKKPY
jgi:purine-nucleoside phosphorylase